MGGTKKLSKFIVDWENGIRVACCAIEREMCHSCISVTDEVKINELNTSIATGPLYAHTEFEDDLHHDCVKTKDDEIDHWTKR